MESIKALQGQLFRYAQDLSELMAQQSNSQKRYQMLLQSLGFGRLRERLMADMLLQVADLNWVTDAQGNILFASLAAARFFHVPGRELKGLHVSKLVSDSQGGSLQGLMDTVNRLGSQGPIQQRRLKYCGDLPAENLDSCEALVMPVSKHGHLEIYWLLGSAPETEASLLDIQKSFPLFRETDESLIVTNQAGDIQAVNPAFSRITGYSESEVLGQNPRLFRSGLQDAESYKALWAQLIDVGSWTGEIFNRRKNGQIFLVAESIKSVRNADDETLFYMGTFADLTTSTLDTKILTQMAFHDPLTGLPNRRLLEDRFQLAMADASHENDSMSVLVIDLDHFKPINDELGHDVGDLVLQTVARRLQASVRRMDTCARVGGDEFVVVLHSTKSSDDIEAIANSILLAIAAPIKVGQRELFVEASIGCARYPQDGPDMPILLKKADAAMYGAKRFGTKFCFYRDGND